MYAVASTLVILSAAASAQDTLVITADNPGEWGPGVALELDWRVGALEGEEHEMFGGISDIAPSPTGDVFVADWQVPIIRWFDASGRYKGDIGGKGRGPGEYLQINGIRTFPNGELAIQDNRNRRITVFDTDGLFSRSFPHHSGLNSGDQTFHIDIAGRVYVLARAHLGRPTPGDVWRNAWLRYSPDGELLDTLRIPDEDPEAESFVHIRPNGRRRPFTIQTVSALSPLGYVVWGRTDAYSFHRSLPDGRVVKVIRDYTPVPISSAERSNWEAWGDYFSGVGRSVLGTESRYPPVPHVKPPFRAIWVDLDGRIWVERYVSAYRIETHDEGRDDRGDRPSLQWRELGTFDVFNPGGSYLGTVTAPENTTVVNARGMKAWGYERGRFDEYYVVQFSIEPGGNE